MPRIPTVETFSPRTQQVGVRGQANTAEFAALRRVGDSMSQVGGFMERYAQEKQAHVNKGKIAEAFLGNKATETQIQTEIEKHGNEPEKWPEIAQKAWQKRQRELNKMNLSPDAKREVEEQFKRFQETNFTQVVAQKSKREIQQANANIIRLAMDMRRNGDREGAEATLNQLNMEPVAKERMIQRTMEEGAYQEVFQMIQTNPSDEEFLEDLQSRLKNKEGKEYTNFEGLGYDARITLQNQVLSKLRGIERDRARNARDLQRAVEKGEASVEEIEQADIGEPERQFLKQQAQQAQKFEELSSTAYESILSDIERNWAQRKLGLERQPDDKDYQNILKDINKAKLTKSSKIKLFDKLLTLKSEDLSDTQEEAQGWFFDRDISEPEAELRSELLEDYRDVIDDVGYETAGGLLFSQEQEIREWFDSENIEKTPETINAFKQRLKNEIYGKAADNMAGDAYEGL